MSDDQKRVDPTEDPRFWAVQIGRGMGPVTLGTPREEMVARLKELGFAVEEDDAEPNEFYLAEADAFLYFDESAPHPLIRIDVDDDRVHFGSVNVLGKRPTEILDLLQIPASETIWCDDFYQINDPTVTFDPPEPKSDAELLKSGTLWITSLGIGMTLYSQDIGTLHVIDPARSPRVGLGGYTGAQRHLAEKQQIGELSTRQFNNHPAQRAVKLLLLIGLFAGLGTVVMKGMKEQQRWNSVPDVNAEVIAVAPPPPNPFPDFFTLQYTDATGKRYEKSLARKELFGMPAIGDQVPIRFQPELPNEPLGPARWQDIAFETYSPYGLAVIGVYLAVQVASTILFGFMLRRP